MEAEASPMQPAPAQEPSTEVQAEDEFWVRTIVKNNESTPVTTMPTPDTCIDGAQVGVSSPACLTEAHACCQERH